MGRRNTALVCLLLVGAACTGADEPADRALDEYVATLRELNAALEPVTDDATARTAEPRVRAAVVDRLQPLFDRGFRFEASAADRRAGRNGGRHASLCLDAIGQHSRFGYHCRRLARLPAAESVLAALLDGASRCLPAARAPVAPTPSAD